MYTGGAEMETSAVAFHESGHCVVGLSLGISVAGAAIRVGTPRDRPAGVCLVGEPVSREAMAAALLEPSEPQRIDAPSGTSLIDFLVFLQAGHTAAVKKYGPRDIAWNDRFQAEQLLADALHLDPCAPGVRLAIAVIERAARRHCEEHWAWITAVAEYLVRHQTIDADQIRVLRTTTKTTTTERAAAPLAHAAEVTA